jgi:hypothetical protein
VAVQRAGSLPRVLHEIGDAGSASAVNLEIGNRLFQDCDPQLLLFALLGLHCSQSAHPFRTLDNVLATPHLGYVSHGLYKTFYEDTVSNIQKWIDSH